MSEDLTLSHRVRTLYSDHHGWLQAWLRRRLGCALDAADITHDIFVSVLSRRNAETIREPRAYLTTIAHGLLVNHVRREELERAYLHALTALPEPQIPDPETRAIWFETLIEIDAMLDDLPHKTRRAFLLAQLEGLTYAEIAAQLGVSVSSVKQYMVKAVSHCLRFTN